MNGAVAERQKILIVDDDPAVSGIFAEALRHRGYVVRVAPSGERGLQEVRADRPDVVLLDITMPDWNGLDVLAQITRIDNTIPVIMVTGLLDDGICRRALEQGAYSWLTKPIDLGVLEQFVTLALGRRAYRGIGR